ncbi:hypothetical protein A2415_01570 [candidate division WWE3 bacterium RIFOXYC1_FULL_39_7]|uniref:Uncharacterized protein n=2 Tax=Katanobacteria TaxID=422282 RepID=A0A1F4X5A0_UNCKA|nr:MAG: hypothetical protein A2415_01570 [candidate division WWE3 bacterium RIFOXYC1_FULL_39_7]OGC76789.1 MAG: hypothetical protein A2619_00495 [candidate division WWE3 bacterium RIFOXYD1_FULL_39_9]
MNTTFESLADGEVKELENLREGSIVTRVRLAIHWATQLAHYVETSSELQTNPKKFSFPSVVGWIEKDHKAFGAGVDVYDSYESTFFTIRFNGGIVVRMRMLANEGNGRLHWKIDGCSVEYPQNFWTRSSEVTSKKVLRLGPDDVQKILDSYKEDLLDRITIGEFGVDHDAAVAVHSGEIQVAVYVYPFDDPENSHWCHVVVSKELEPFVENKHGLVRLNENTEGLATYFVDGADFNDIVRMFTDDYIVTVTQIFAE